MQLNNTIDKTWIEISKEALVHNFRQFKKITADRTKIMAVVKANAYGHDLRIVAPILGRAGTDWFGVDSLEEALQIRSLEIDTPILVLGYISPPNIKTAIEYNISITVYGSEVLKKITSLKLQKKAKIHLKVETGLNRQGLEPIEFIKLIKFINKHEDNICLEGVSTHFANVEDTLDPTFALSQLDRFKQIRGMINELGFKKVNYHCAASAAAMLYKRAHFNMIRAGVGLYGLWPSKETQIALKLRKGNSFSLKPALSWKSVLAQVKKVKAGESVSYGRTWFAPRDSIIGIVPVGYYDGYDRKLSNNSKIIVKGEYVPVVGRIAMNMIMVDLTNAKDVEAGENVILLGKYKNKEVSADFLADNVGTINYEIVSRINPNIARKVV